MLLRTHLAFAILIIILFLPHVSNQGIFILIVAIATMLPDIDTGFSTAGRGALFKVVQVFTKHRGGFHSLTFCVIASAVFAVFIPVLSLGFFLGYSFHLLLDSFTIEGIMPLWPWGKISKGVFRTGGKSETTLFAVILFLDLIAAILFIRGL